MIETGDRITVHFEFAIEPGKPLESTFGDEPEEFRFGSGEFPPYLERRLAEMTRGEVAEFTIPASEAVFGVHNRDNRHSLPRTDFDQLDCHPGVLVEFDLPNGEHVSGRIEEVGDDEVWVDFNNPLAGRDVRCRLQLVAVTRSDEAS